MKRGMTMRRLVRLLLAPLLVLLCSGPAWAADPGLAPLPIIRLPIVIDQKPTPVAFGAVANRYTGVAPGTVFDLDGDLVGDVKVSGDTVTAQNGAGIQLIQPDALNLDQINSVPTIGYGASAPVKLSRVYVAQLAGGGYAKFMLLQTAPKVTIWFHYGRPTSSVLTAKGDGGKAALTWDPLPDATLGYNIYRYEVTDNSYTVTVLNDFTVKETSFTDHTASNRYYLYLVQAIKAGGSPGALTTVAPVFVTSLQRSMVIPLNSTKATVDGASVTLATKAVIRNGLMMIPASALTHAGVKVTLDSASGRLTLSRRLDSITYTVVMTVDSPDYQWNGQAQTTSVPPYKVGSEVMLPLRVIAPVLGLGVTFNSTDQTAALSWYE